MEKVKREKLVARPDKETYMGKLIGAPESSAPSAQVHLMARTGTFGTVPTESKPSI